MSCAQSGIDAVKKGDFAAAEKCFLNGFLFEGEDFAGANLAAMLSDARITEKTDVSVCKAMFLWLMTKNSIASSEHKLGVTLYGMVNSQHKAEAVQMIKNASEKDYQPAICVMGVLACASGNYDSAINYFSRYEGIRNDKRALLSFAEALTEKGLGKSKEIKEIYTALAENFGETKAYFELAMMCDREYEKDQYLGKAIENNYLPAVFYVACEKFRKSEYEKAFSYFQRAYDGGICESAKYLGIVFGNGYGCIPDKNKARFYFDIATKNDFECWREQAEAARFFNDEEWEYLALENQRRCGKDIDNLRHFELKYKFESGRDDKADELFALAMDCVNRGLNSFYIAKTVGIALYYGKSYLGKDAELSVKCLLPYGDDPDCAEVLGLAAAYEETTLLKPAEAENYLKFASDNGSAIATLTLGKLYRVWQLYANAANQFNRAYRMGSVEAAELLSEMYMNGEVSGKKDKKMASLWADRAAFK